MIGVYVIAAELNSSDPDVHAALAAGDRHWLEARVRALVARGVDAIDLNAGTFGRSEIDVLEWMCESTEAIVDLPLSIDSADVGVIERIGAGRRVAPILNSLDVDALVEGRWPAALDREGTQLVVQLRRGARLPATRRDRLEAAAQVVATLDRRGFARERVLLDGVMLPWGPDETAGAGLVEFVEEAALRWPGLRTLVGLTNVSYGHGDGPALHAQWLDRLARAGLGAVLLDALDATCMAIARRR